MQHSQYNLFYKTCDSFEPVLFSESNIKCSQCNRIPNSYELVIFNDKTISAVLHFCQCYLIEINKWNMFKKNDMLNC